MQNSDPIAWKINKNIEKNAMFSLNNMENSPKAQRPSQDVWKFTIVSYRTSALWGRCPALTPLLQLITPSRASGTADHVRSLDDLSFSIPSFFLLFWAAAPKGRCPVGHRDEFPDVHISIPSICQASNQPS